MFNFLDALLPNLQLSFQQYPSTGVCLTAPGHSLFFTKDPILCYT